MVLNVEFCSPSGTYVVIEEVHPLDAVGQVISSQLVGEIQIYRHVYQACLYQDYMFDGRRIESGRPTTWQYIKHYMSGRDRITTQPNGRDGWLLAYAGSRKIITPLEALKNNFPGIFNAIPDVVTKTRVVNKSPYNIGTDPIPATLLYGKSNVAFNSIGGTTPPRAIAIYDGASKQLRPVNNALESEKMIAEFMRNKQ